MKIAAFSFLLCLAAPVLHAGEPLFRMTATLGGAQKDSVFQEVERSDTSSTVEAVVHGASVAAKSMFMLRGSCALLKERDGHGFRIQPLSKQPIRFIVHLLPKEEVREIPIGQSMNQNSVISAQWCETIRSLPGQ